MTENYLWVRQCVLSCVTEWQLNSCKELINLFVKKHWNETGMVDDFFALATVWKEKLESLPKVE